MKSVQHSDICPELNDSENKISEASCNLVDTMERACEREGVNLAIISGQYSDGTNSRIDSYIGNRQITLWSELFKNFKLNPKASQAEIKKALDNLFEYVKVPQSIVLKVLEQLPYKTNHLTK